VTLLDEEAGTQMLSFFSTTVVLLLGTAVSLAYLFDALSSLPLRPATLICALALATLIGIRKGHARIAGQILIWGAGRSSWRPPRSAAAIAVSAS
jgi:hypothetical protein